MQATYLNLNIATPNSPALQFLFVLRFAILTCPLLSKHATVARPSLDTVGGLSACCDSEWGIVLTQGLCCPKNTEEHVYLL